MTCQSRIDAEALCKLLSYDPETGAFLWRHRNDSHFSAPRYAAAWNGKWAGKPALTSVDADRYLQGSIFGHLFKAHRVAFAIANGRWPNGQVDHINGVRTDNRLANLREVSNAENHKNRKISALNSSGTSGVCRVGSSGKWRAQIRGAKGRKISLGTFEDIGDAISARRKAEVELGYHQNHGRS